MGMIVGIDPSLSRTALMSMDTDTGDIERYTFAGYGLPKGSPWWTSHRRVQTIVNEIEMFLHHETKGLTCLDLVVFEGPSYGSKGSMAFSIGSLMGGIHELLCMHIPLRNGIEVPPSNLKKFATGKGNANKALIAAHVQKRWNVIFEDDNLTDAYVLCQIGRAMLGKISMPKSNMTALEKVKRYVENERRD